MKLVLVFVGTPKQTWLTEVTDRYRAMIERFCPQVELIRIKPSRQSRDSADRRIEAESKAILKSVNRGDHLIVCDEKGRMLTSKQYSARLAAAFESGSSRVVMVVGGAFGLSDEVKARADLLWSLSALTFNHPLAQVIALEQTYRALTIWKNFPYHNETT